MIEMNAAEFDRVIPSFHKALEQFQWVLNINTIQAAVMIQLTSIAQAG
jgi:hypothetical protein